MEDDRPQKILVVDDDTTLLDLLVDTLTAIGYDTTPAPGGVEALEALATEKFDLMVTDIKMPTIDGISLLKKVRRHYPDMPVVFITGVASPEIIAGTDPDGFLAKPFRISHIEEMIKRALDSQPPRRTLPGRRILVVDFNRESRELTADLLNRQGVIPFAVSSVSDATRELENGELDAVITDRLLPPDDHRELMDAIRTEHPDLPVIVVGDSHHEQPLRRFALEHSLHGYLTRPFEAGDLIAVLDAATASGN